MNKSHTHETPDCAAGASWGSHPLPHDQSVIELKALLKKIAVESTAKLKKYIHDEYIHCKFQKLLFFRPDHLY
jgi:hypothetical protein